MSNAAVFHITSTQYATTGVISITQITLRILEADLIRQCFIG